jgi:hypothetical protein
MIEANSQQGAYMAVVQRVIYNFAVAPALDETQSSQHFEMLGHRRFADTDDSGKVAGAKLLIKEAVDYRSAAGVRERLEGTGQRRVLM